MDFLRITEEGMVCKHTLEAGLVDVDQVVCARRAKHIAYAIIDEKGEFDQKRGQEISDHLDMPKETYLQKLFFHHVRHVLGLFIESKHAKLRLKQLSFPLANPFVETLIARSLCKKEEAELTKRDISLSLVIALLTPLRQSVGSCFATAPLMMVQYEQSFFLFEELYNLVTRGYIKRVIDGKEVRVPMSTKTGLGDLSTPMGSKSHIDPSLLEAFEKEKLKDSMPPESIRSYIKRSSNNPKIVEEHFKAKTQSLILKCYEYTVASLSDWKTEFTNWNIYTSLGLDHNQKGGLGEVVYTLLDEKLNKSQEELSKIAEEVYQTEREIRTFETLLRNAADPDKIRRLKGEIQAKAHHMYVHEDMHYNEIERTKKIAEFFKFVVEQLMRLFPEYFQEVFDPEMVSSNEGDILEDRPAGFRLLYKHGRFDPSVWTMIYTREDYVSQLKQFFRAIEHLLFLALDWDEGKDLVEEVIDCLVEHVETQHFMETAISRTTEMHLKTLSEGGERTPWAYESGGSVDFLVGCYFRMTNNPKKVEFHPNTPRDLLCDLLEWMKDAPYKDTNRFDSDATHGENMQGILMTSPVHAFVFKPGIESFQKAWGSNANTFTYVRDEVEGRIKQLYHQHPLAPQEIEKVEDLMIPFGMPRCKYFDEVSSWAQEQPLLIRTVAAEVVLNLYAQKGLSLDIAFADTNWASDLFTFVVNPITLEIELWRKGAVYYRALPGWVAHFQGKSWSLYLDQFKVAMTSEHNKLF